MSSIERTGRGKVLVVYYSLTGNTARVARDLATMIGADVESVRDRSHGVGFLSYMKGAWHAVRRTPAEIAPLRHDPSEYALTLIGTPVWVGRITPAIRGYLLQSAPKLTNVGFFVTSGDTDVSKVAPALQAMAGRKTVITKGFNARELKDAARYNQKLAELANDAQRFVLRGTAAAA